MKSKSIPVGTLRIYPQQALPQRLDGDERLSGNNKYICRDYLWPIGFQILHRGIALYLHRLSAPGHEMVIMR